MDQGNRRDEIVNDFLLSLAGAFDIDSYQGAIQVMDGMTLGNDAYAFSVAARESRERYDSMKKLNNNTIDCMLKLVHCTALLGEAWDKIKKHLYYGTELSHSDVWQAMALCGEAHNLEATASQNGNIHNMSFEQFRLLHASIGAVTESAELIEKLWSSAIHAQPLDAVNFIEELGDVVWYIVASCNVFGITIGNVMYINDAKLALRYGSVFSTECAEVRDLVAERKQLTENVLALLEHEAS